MPPRSYVVQPGDNWIGIALAQLANASLADALAGQNGRNPSQDPPVGRPIWLTIDAEPCMEGAGPNCSGLARLSEVVLAADASEIDFPGIPTSYRDLRLVVVGRATGDGFLSSITVEINDDQAADAGGGWIWDRVQDDAASPGLWAANAINGTGQMLAGNLPADKAEVKATLTTALAGDNNDLRYTAKAIGKAGNDVTVEYVDPAAPSAPLGVVVAGSAITVNLATDGSSVIVTTAADIAAAVAASGPADALVGVANAAGNDGTGIVTAMAEAALSGGIDVLDPSVAGSITMDFPGYSLGTWYKTAHSVSGIMKDADEGTHQFNSDKLELYRHFTWRNTLDPIDRIRLVAPGRSFKAGTRATLYGLR